MSQRKIYRAVGLMSGTSADGVDAALIATDGEEKIEFFGGSTLPYDESLRSRILEASQHDVPTTELLRLEKKVSQSHAEAVRALLSQLGESKSSVDVIGFHGHTVRHVPDEDLTLQIGNPWLLHAEIGIPVASDFRRRDIASGGQGAPLASMFHQAILAGQAKPTCVLNLGGVANITWLGEHNEILAGDTGPGCGLLDKWVQQKAGLSYDVDGQLARQGVVQQDLVDNTLDRDFFRRPLPKSADRFDFDHVDVSALSVEDGAATLCAITVQAVVRAVETMPSRPKTFWVTGGGVHHTVIMDQLRAHYPNVKNIRDLGYKPDMLEAECFAWLAVRHLLKLPLSLPETTGCRQPSTGAVLCC